MEFSQLKYVVEIVEAGSISKAAENLFISQPNLSTQIFNLEKELGKDIFERSNRGVKLTSYGVEVYYQARYLVEQYDLVEDKLLFKKDVNRIKITSFGSEIIDIHFMKMCEKFNRNDHIFEIYELGVEESIDRVLQRDCDIGIIIYSGFQKNMLKQYLKSRKLELEDLFVGDLKVHISSNSPLSSKEYLTYNDLKDLFHVKKSYLFDGVFNLNYELEYLGIPDTNKSVITDSNKTYNDALHSLPSFAMEVDWDCKYKIFSDLKRISFENKELDIICGLVKREKEELKEELQFFKESLIEAYSQKKGDTYED